MRLGGAAVKRVLARGVRSGPDSAGIAIITLVASESQLANLRRLDKVWGQLEELVKRCGSSRTVTREDEEEHRALLREARVLYGHTQSLIGSGGITGGGRHFDSFQFVLGQQNLSGVFEPFQGSSWWRQLWGVAASAIGQAPQQSWSLSFPYPAKEQSSMARILASSSGCLSSSWSSSKTSTGMGWRGAWEADVTLKTSWSGISIVLKIPTFW